MSGINTARKLRRTREQNLRRNRSPFLRRPHVANGLVVGFYQMEAKQPSSGKRPCVKVDLGKKRGVVLSFIHKDGVSKLIKIHDTVRIQSLGGAMGRSMGDLSGCRYRVTSINRVPILGLFRKTQTL